MNKSYIHFCNVMRFHGHHDTSCFSWHCDFLTQEFLRTRIFFEEHEKVQVKLHQKSTWHDSWCHIICFICNASSYATSSIILPPNKLANLSVFNDVLLKLCIENIFGFQIESTGCQPPIEKLINRSNLAKVLITYRKYVFHILTLFCILKFRYLQGIIYSA